MIITDHVLHLNIMNQRKMIYFCGFKLLIRNKRYCAGAKSSYICGLAPIAVLKVVLTCICCANGIFPISWPPTETETLSASLALFADK